MREAEGVYEGMKVISAKIPQELFAELEELRKALGFTTRQAIIEHSLRAYLFAVKSIPAEDGQ